MKSVQTTIKRNEDRTERKKISQCMHQCNKNILHYKSFGSIINMPTHMGILGHNVNMYIGVDHDQKVGTLFIVRISGSYKAE